MKQSGKLKFEIEGVVNRLQQKRKKIFLKHYIHLSCITTSVIRAEQSNNLFSKFSFHLALNAESSLGKRGHKVCI